MHRARRIAKTCSGSWLKVSAAFLVLLLGAGCKPKAGQGSTNATASSEQPTPKAEHAASDQPTTEDVAGFLRAAAPPFAQVSDVKMDAPVARPNTSPAQHLWVCSVRFAFTPTEDLLGPASEQDARSFLDVNEDLSAWTRWREAYARSPYARLYPASAWQAPASPVPAGQPILARLHPAGQELPPIYARLAAEWRVDHWQFRATDLDLPDYGGPRASFDSPNVVLGSAEATTFLQVARMAISQAKATKAEVDARYRVDQAKTVHPGTLFAGQLTHRSAVVPVEVRVLPAGSGADSQQDVTLEVRLTATPGESFTYQARLSAQVPLALPATTAVDPSSPAPTPPELASMPSGDLRLRLLTSTGKERPVGDPSIPGELLFITRHYPPPPAVWLHLHDGHLEGRLGGYETDTTGFVLTAQPQTPTP